MNDRLPLLVAAPMNTWQHGADHIDAETLRALSDEAADLAVKAARASAYLNARYLGRAHIDGVDAQNRVAKALRKAFGFTYPQDDISF